MTTLFQAVWRNQRQVNGLARSSFPDEGFASFAKPLCFFCVDLVWPVGIFHFTKVHNTVIAVNDKVNLGTRMSLRPRETP